MRFILFLLLSFFSTTAFSKSVNLTMNAYVSTCIKNIQCEIVDSSFDLTVRMGPLDNTGMDIGIVDLDFPSPIQKFNFKMIASIHETEKEMELLFAAFDEKYKVNKVLIKMPVPSVLKEGFKLDSPVFKNSNAVTSKLTLEILRVETLAD